VLHLTSAFRFPSATTEFITQLAFSPTRNILAWTDFAGSLYRWSDPIPSSSPSPVASTSTSTSALTRPVRRGPTPTLFDDEAAGHTSKQQANEDVGPGGADDFENEDWILDDVGDKMEDDVGAQGDDGHEFVKEMGMEYFHSAAMCPDFLHSKCDEGAACLPTGLYSN
jgi:chromosome transmission fidelity protein 4